MGEPAGFGDYRKVSVNAVPSRALSFTPETKWWRELQQPVLTPHLGPVTHCEYEPSSSSSSSSGGGGGEARSLLVTSATRLLLYDFYTHRVKKQFTRFASTAYSGTFRKDGKMVAAGSDSGLVQLFSADQSRDVLRQLVHSANGKSIRCVRFTKGTNTNLVSCGDDALVKYWDISLGEHLSTFAGHSDYVRSVSCGSGDLLLTGGYDHKCMLWDVRTPKKAVRSWTHASGAPVEDVLLLPSGTMAVSCGSTKVRLWDVLSGKMIASLENHQKTVTSLRHAVVEGSVGGTSFQGEEEEGNESENGTDANMNSSDSNNNNKRSWSPGPRLLTGSIDGHVKVYELDKFELVHSTKYPDPVLSFDCSPGAYQLAVGMGNGMLAVRTRPKKKATPRGGDYNAVQAGGGSNALQSAGGGRRPKWKSMLTANSYRYFLRGQNTRLTEEQRADTSIAIAEKPKKINLKPFDKSLKKFRYREALDQSLATRDPGVVLAVLELLCAHGGDGHALQAALSQRNATGLQPIMRILCKYVADPRTMKVSVPIAHAIFDLYSQFLGISPEFDTKVMQLHERVHAEVKAQDELIKLQGMLEPLLFAQYSASGTQT